MEIYHVNGGSLGGEILSNSEIEPLMPIFLEASEIDKQEDTLKRPMINDSDSVQPMLPVFE